MLSSVTFLIATATFVAFSWALKGHFASVTQALAAVRREHMPFYARKFRMMPICEPRAYFQLIKPLSLFYEDCRIALPGVMARNPFLRPVSGELGRLSKFISR
jgi:hypothetical protein